MELLCPAGNFGKLKTAILYGADAVYFSGQEFSLRAASENFSSTELKQAVSYCKKRGVKAYLTLNAFFSEQEIKKFDSFLEILPDLAFDAFIVADLGLIPKLQKKTSSAIHISTQVSVLNAYQAQFFKDLGAKRVILGREASLEDAAKIKEQCQLEVELFAHGAMCMAYSGDCVISNYTKGRDSNRGGCIQSCRHNFELRTAKGGVFQEKSSFLSSKDLNALALIPEFYRYGIDSIKMEGRMKSLLYLAATTTVYKSALYAFENQLKYPLQSLEKILEDLAHRGYTTGSLVKKADQTSVFCQGEKEQGALLAGQVILQDAQKRTYFQLANRLEADSQIIFLQPQAFGQAQFAFTDHNWALPFSPQGLKTLDASYPVLQSGRVIHWESPFFLPAGTVAYQKPKKEGPSS